MDSCSAWGSPIMPKSNLRIVPPATENGTVLAMQPPRRPPNRELREREHLTDAEVEQLVEAARGNRYGTRGALMVLRGRYLLLQGIRVLKRWPPACD
jgi:hypothetical protein